MCLSSYGLDSVSSSRQSVIFYELHSRKLPVAMLLSIEPRYFSRSKTDRQTDDETLLVDLPPQFSSHTVHFYIRLLPLFHTPSTSVHFITINTEWQFNVSFVSGSVSSSAIHRVIKYILIHLLIFRYGEVIRWWLVLSLIRCEFSGRRRWSCHG